MLRDWAETALQRPFPRQTLLVLKDVTLLNYCFALTVLFSNTSVVRQGCEQRVVGPRAGVWQGGQLGLLPETKRR